ncbi:hypothetical protein BJ875DRAFT_235529 [Amylocarpus encephaloides]|uniref:Uncharacterized protein n=1 Tax=Amylocarpus encephaloides TaxID=45428 RepID=A0A9P7YML8_9HELO|nr:hypothetical protein BJ875DRAFT_235529 [Amylocarpus encephaloides]
MASKSFISQPIYNQDWVVAVTQGSINSTMLAYLDTVQQTEMTAIVAYSLETGLPALYTLAEFQARSATTQDIDPFQTGISPGATPFESDILSDLYHAGFISGLRAKMGIPQPPEDMDEDQFEAFFANIPDIINLAGDAKRVTFNMLTSSFKIVALQESVVNGVRDNRWFEVEQQPEEVWQFQSHVDISKTTVPQEEYQNLSLDINNRIREVQQSQRPFSVQKLLLDLTTVSFMDQPTIQGVEPGTKPYLLLNDHFTNTYFGLMKETGGPLLNVAIVEGPAEISTMPLTNMNIGVNPLLGDDGQIIEQPTKQQRDLSTLNYLCATGNHPLNLPVTFNWNWITQAEAGLYHGVLSINRNTFAEYLQAKLTPYVKTNCLKPSADIQREHLQQITLVHGLQRNQKPDSITLTTSGTEAVLKYAYHGEDSDVDKNFEFGLKSDYSLELRFAGKQIQVRQNFKVNMRLQIRFGAEESGNIVDKTITDTYTLGVDGTNGRLTARQGEPVIENHAEDLEFNGWANFFGAGGDANGVVDDIKTWATTVTATAIRDDPGNLGHTIQGYLFPGGKTFVFADVGFSPKQDLVAFLTYV